MVFVGRTRTRRALVETTTTASTCCTNTLSALNYRSSPLAERWGRDSGTMGRKGEGRGWEGCCYDFGGGQVGKRGDTQRAARACALRPWSMISVALRFGQEVNITQYDWPYREAGPSVFVVSNFFVSVQRERPKSDGVMKENTCAQFSN